jgi:ribosomal protein S9
MGYIQNNFSDLLLLNSRIASLLHFFVDFVAFLLITSLNQSLFLRRDSRIKERRKYGLKKARKASQYSKR